MGGVSARRALLAPALVSVVVAAIAIGSTWATPLGPLSRPAPDAQELRAAVPPPSPTPPVRAGVPQWNVSCSPCSPGARQAAQMVYDPKDGYDVLFGGQYDEVLQGVNEPGDTWTYKGGVWTNITATACPNGCPPVRTEMGMAYDYADGYVVMFGGYEYWSKTFYSDTWAFSGGVWTELSPSESPSARAYPSMAWDGSDGYVLLFGGEIDGIALGDTWSFVGGQWSLISLSGGPDPRSTAGMAWDPVDNEVVLYGGLSGTTYFSDTWVFQYGAWSEIYPTTDPGSLALITNLMTWDSAIGAILLFGGADQPSPLTTEGGTWTFVGGQWTSQAVAAAPPARLGASLADDPPDGTAVLFGGWESSTVGDAEDTWTYFGGFPPLTAGLVATPSVTDVHSPVAFGITAYGGTPPFTETLRLGDGTTVTPTAAVVYHNYTVPGTYTAWLWVNDSATGRTSAQATVTVHAAPTATPSASPDPVDVGVPVTFSAGFAGGTGPFHANWTFGDGGTSNALAPTHAYATPGSYLVHLWANDSLGKGANGTLTVTVNPLLTVSATDSPAGGEAGVYLHFNATSSGGTPAYAIAWKFGDGGAGTGASISHQFLSAGNYTVRVWANDSGGGVATSTLSVPIVRGIVGLAISASPNPANLGAPVTFSSSFYGGTSPFSYLWTFGDGSSPSTSVSPTHAYAAAGTYTATLVVSDAAHGQSSATASVTVYSAFDLTSFTGNFPGSPGHDVDVGQSLTLTVATSGGVAPLAYAYTGLPGGCASADLSTLSCAPTATGNFTATVTVTDSTSRSVSASLSFSVDAQLRLLGFSPSAVGGAISVGASTALLSSVTGGTAPLAYSYGGLPAGCVSWDEANLSCSPSAAGHFDVRLTVTDALAETSSRSLNLTVNSDPIIATFTVDPTNASWEQIVTFTIYATDGTGTLSYRFAGLPAGCSSDPPGPTGGSCTPTVAGTFHVDLTVSDEDGREANASLTLHVASQPDVPLATLENFWWIWLPVVVVVLVLLAFAWERRRRPPKPPEHEAEVGVGAFAGVSSDVLLREVAPAPEGHALADDAKVAKEDTTAPIPGLAPEGYAHEPSPSPAPVAEPVPAPVPPEKAPSVELTNAPSLTATSPGSAPWDEGASSGSVEVGSPALEALPPELRSLPASGPTSGDRAEVDAKGADDPTGLLASLTGTSSAPGTRCPVCSGDLDSSRRCPACGITWKPDDLVT